MPCPALRPPRGHGAPWSWPAGPPCLDLLPPAQPPPPPALTAYWRRPLFRFFRFSVARSDPTLHEDAYHSLANRVVRTPEPYSNANPAGLLAPRPNRPQGSFVRVLGYPASGVATRWPGSRNRAPGEPAVRIGSAVARESQRNCERPQEVPQDPVLAGQPVDSAVRPRSGLRGQTSRIEGSNPSASALSTCGFSQRDDHRAALG
jgi:hypothetical protein